MTNFKLLLVEDNQEDIDTCQSSIIRYNDEHTRNIDLVVAKDLQEALVILDSTFDGVIIDLQLGSDKDGGNKISDCISNRNFRMPFAFFTATPDAAVAEYEYMGVFKKGETQYDEILDKFWEIHSTGITRIMGGRGEIEKALNSVFINNILPFRDKWISYGLSDAQRTEKSLLRHTLNHLIHLLDDHTDMFFPEEVYIHPLLGTNILPGNIVYETEPNNPFVVLNPACDLAIRSNNSFNTDRILVVEVETTDSVSSKILDGITKKDKKEKAIRNAFNNNYSNYYHWLPETTFFQGGFMNFRKLSSLSVEDFNTKFDAAKTQITASFLKDILGRFSSYYARQGQPSIDSLEEISKILG